MEEGQSNAPQVATQTKSKSKVKVAVAIAGLIAAAAIIGYISLKFNIVKIQDPVLLDPGIEVQRGPNG